MTSAPSQIGKSSPKKLALYLAFLAIPLIVGPAFRRPPSAAPLSHSVTSRPADAALHETVLAGRPVDELFGDLQIIGVPSFILKARVTNEIELKPPSTLSFTLRRNGKLVGRFVERLVRVDDDRTKVDVEFQPGDAKEMAAIAAPIGSDWSASELFVRVMREQIQSTIDRRGFEFSVLQMSPVSPGVLALVSGAAPRPGEWSNNGPDKEQATIRRAYRAEATQAGPDADKL